uniref:Uncharacterized protein n=1 Tax=Heterorhabditis bacteriophora TaxID=37862 RepID=A0A1I7WDI5_HETBA
MWVFLFLYFILFIVIKQVETLDSLVYLVCLISNQLDYRVLFLYCLYRDLFVCLGLRLSSDPSYIILIFIFVLLLFLIIVFICSIIEVKEKLEYFIDLFPGEYNSFCSYIFFSFICRYLKDYCLFVLCFVLSRLNVMHVVYCIDGADLSSGSGIYPGKIFFSDADLELGEKLLAKVPYQGEIYGSPQVDVKITYPSYYSENGEFIKGKVITSEVSFVLRFQLQLYQMIILLRLKLMKL